MVVSVYILAVYNVLLITLIQETAEIQFLLRGRSFPYSILLFSVSRYIGGLSLAGCWFGKKRDI